MEGASLELFADQINGEKNFPISVEDVMASSDALEKIILAAQ